MVKLMQSLAFHPKLGFIILQGQLYEARFYPSAATRDSLMCSKPGKANERKFMYFLHYTGLGQSCPTRKKHPGDGL